jgi:sarcosine oxidase subunit alpha
VGPYRLERGGQIDRSTPIPFTFNGRPLTGYAGDSLASGLLGNGVRILARSLRFHRPRGLFSCGVEEPSGLLQLEAGARAIPVARATTVALTAGLEAHTGLGWPGVRCDLGRVLDVLSPLWAAGFYNKTFIWPSWHTYEGIIRRMAGLGRAPTGRDPDRYEVGNLHCDVLVVGGGVAGLRAALEAGRSGARVVLAEQDLRFGGEASWRGGSIDGVPAATWLSETLNALSRLPDVRLMSCTSAVGVYDHNVVTLLERARPSPGDIDLARKRLTSIEHAHGGGKSDKAAHSSTNSPRERYWIVRTGRVVLATGAIEQPLIFSNNDRPGIMLASAAHQYLLRYGVALGTRVLIATNNDSAYELARDLVAAGVTLLGVADARQHVPEALRESLKSLSIPLLTGTMPVDTAGFGALSRVTLGRLSADGSHIDARQTFRCDALAVSGGFSPTLHLFAQAGGKLAYDDTSGALWPVARHRHFDIVGRAAERVAIGPRISPIGDPKRQWVDLLHDVTVADLELAARENFTSIEHVKRYTTVGMAADQGKTSSAATLSVLAKMRGIAARELGHTTLRPPFTPVTLGAIAGRDIGERFAPRRLLPMHAWHVANGALMHDFGEWLRPVAYPRAGESRQSAAWREARAVRMAAGLFDGSPLGKIEIRGPDALTFLDRFYINDLTTLTPHRARYGLMLRESGVVWDDGTVVMRAPDRLWVTTTSGNAGRVAQWLEEWRQCEWPRLRVAVVPVTEQWATITLAGPNARAILAKLPADIDLSAQAFPHMAMREGQLMGVPVRVCRVSYTGELSYEIHVASGKAPVLWEALMEHGADEGLQPLGIDALLLLRLEKGFVHIGTDTDGTTVPDDIGWGDVARRKQADFVGKRSLSLPEHLRTDRLQLVGLTTGPGAAVLPVGSHLRLQDSAQASDGWITSAGATVLKNERIALALLRGGRARVGAEVDVYDDGAIVTRARVVRPPFYDSSGERMNA